MTEDTFTLLNRHGQFEARGTSISDMMLLMDQRWAGTLVCDKTGTVLFDAEKDRPEYADPYKKGWRVPAAIRHANVKLAWDRWHQEQAEQTLQVLNQPWGADLPPSSHPDAPL